MTGSRISSPDATVPFWWVNFAMLLTISGLAAAGISRMLYPFDTGHFESVLWMPTQILLAGHNPYDLHWAQNPPFSLAAYGPLYYAILAFGFACFDTQFWFGRLLSLAALAACAFFIFVLLQRFTARRDLAFLGAGLFCTQAPTTLWVGLQRPDWIALALSLGALCCCCAPHEKVFDKKYSDLNMIAAAILLVAALLCRQTSLIPFFVIAAILWHAARDSSRRPLKIFLGCYTIAVITIIAILNATSDGGFAAQQWIFPSRVTRSADYPIAYAASLFVSPSAWVVTLTTWAGWRKQKSVPRFVSNNFEANPWSLNNDNGEIYKIFQIWLLAASGLAFVTTARIGANLNYWLEPCAAASLLAPLTLHCLQVSWRTVTLCFGGVALAACTMNYLLWIEEKNRWNNLPAKRAVVAALQEHTKPGQPVYAIHPDFAVAANRPYWFNDAYQFSVRSPRFNRFFRQAIREQRVGALIDNPPFPAGYRVISWAEISEGQGELPAFINQMPMLAVPEKIPASFHKPWLGVLPAQRSSKGKNEPKK